MAALQEVRWLDSGEVSIGDTAFIWSGKNDGKHREKVALAVQRKLMSACISLTPINEQLLHAQFRHTARFLSLIVAYAPSENADTPDFAAREVLGKRLCAKKPWISQTTLAITDQRRQAIRREDVEEYRRLPGPRRRSLRHDKQQWMEHVASTGKNHLLCGEIKDAFASFRQLKQKCATSAPLKRWMGNYCPTRHMLLQGGRNTSALY